MQNFLVEGMQADLSDYDGRTPLHLGVWVCWLQRIDTLTPSVVLLL